MGALDGIRVVQTAAAAAGPMASRFLADWGADVICVEYTARRAQLAQRRANPQMTGRRAIVSDIDFNSQNMNRNKRSLTLNLSTDAGREILYKLLTKSDVLLSNFRPRELEKFKLEYETLSKLNPRLICAHLTGYGRKGPDSDAPGYGPIAGDARAGLLHVLLAPGNEPAQLPVSFTDFLTGLSLALGIMTALFVRDKTGVGQEVDVSLFNTMVWAMSNDIAGTLVTGQDRQAVSRRDRANPLMNTYRTKDGRWLYLVGLETNQTYWSRFCQAINRSDLEHDPRFESPVTRMVDNQAALFDILESVFATKTLDEWRQAFAGAVFPWAPLQNLPEVVKDPQARANDFFVPLDHPIYGRMEVLASPIKLSKTPATIRTPAPESGQHTEDILGELGYSHLEIEQLKTENVI
jgi:crotonobetainyl-CoA:carnitine CoA-transferase CaiB-like acyl-CoA transferase